MPEVLDKLDTQIAEHEQKAAEAEQKASEKRDELTSGGDSVPEINSEEFKTATAELEAHYKTYDEENDILADLKGKRQLLGRTIGTPAPADVGGESKGMDPEQLAELIANAQGKAIDQKTFDLGKAVVESDRFKALVEQGRIGEKASGRLGDGLELGKAGTAQDFKDLISAAGTTAFRDAQRMPFEPKRQRAVKILELLQTIPVSTDAVKYAQMTTVTNNAAIVQDPTTAEDIGSGDPAVTTTAAGLKPESAYIFAEKTADIETLAHTLPIHKNTIKDIPQLQAILEDEMTRGLLLYLEAQVISGTGGASQLTGILNASNVISQTIGSDTLIVALHKALTAQRLAFEEPEVIVLHPTDWQTIRLLRNDSGAGAGTGDFLFGPPSMAGDQTIWGIPVVTTPVIPQGKLLMGDFSAAQLYLREGISILASDSHKDFFRRNLILLLAEMRAGFGIRRPAAFAKCV